MSRVLLIYRSTEWIYYFREDGTRERDGGNGSLPATGADGTGDTGQPPRLRRVAVPKSTCDTVNEIWRPWLQSVFNHMHFDIGIVMFVILYVFMILLEMIVNLDVSVYLLVLHTTHGPAHCSMHMQQSCWPSGIWKFSRRSGAGVSCSKAAVDDRCNKDSYTGNHDSIHVQEMKVAILVWVCKLATPIHVLLFNTYIENLRKEKSRREMGRLLLCKNDFFCKHVYRLNFCIAKSITKKCVYSKLHQNCFRSFEILRLFQMLNIHHHSPVPHWLHLMSVSILAYFVVEICLRIYAFGSSLLYARFELFDISLVLGVFVLELVFITHEDAYSSSGLLILLRLWRISNIING